MNIKILFLLSLSIAQQSFGMETAPKKENSLESQLEQNRIALYRINMIQLIDHGFMQEMCQPLNDLMDEFTNKSRALHSVHRKYRDRSGIKNDMIKNFERFNKFFPNKAKKIDEWNGVAFDELRVLMAKEKVILEKEIALREGKEYIPNSKLMDNVLPSPEFIELVTWQFALWSRDQRSK
ncbi:MAG TPA: hypothetical protein VHO47_00330 [Candidatus Babeliales bacterium]|nr:hypothetical protein [Candidatus Babeliales bacterium]